MALQSLFFWARVTKVFAGPDTEGMCNVEWLRPTAGKGGCGRYACESGKEDLPAERLVISRDLRLPSGDAIKSGELPSHAQQRQPKGNSLNDLLGEVLQAPALCTSTQPDSAHDLLETSSPDPLSPTPQAQGPQWQQCVSMTPAWCATFPAAPAPAAATGLGRTTPTTAPVVARPAVPTSLRSGVVPFRPASHRPAAAFGRSPTAQDDHFGFVSDMLSGHLVGG